MFGKKKLPHVFKTSICTHFWLSNVMQHSICYNNVCPSLTSHAHTVKDIKICFAPYHKMMYILLLGQISQPEFMGCP